jgi:cation transport ATPase
MVRSLREGSWGINILALMAIASTLWMGKYLAALVVILMLSGGEALESSAQGRAALELRSVLAKAPLFSHRDRHADPADGLIDQELIRACTGSSRMPPIRGPVAIGPGLPTRHASTISSCQ